MENDTDRQFLDYVNIHSRTPRALFHMSHVRQFIELSGGDSSKYVGESFIAMHYDDISGMLTLAYSKLRNAGVCGNV